MKPLTRKKIQLIKGEIKRWLLLTFMPNKMEVQRLQIFAGIVERQHTSWKGIPTKKRSIVEIIKLKEDPDSVKTKSSNNESNSNRTGDTK